uniref:RNA-directed DNA polymerase, eukaryota n=1 Tax=Tanacetum cinerariifolium TaxID=118510 RepID=A0A6L2NN70_TANCI|nr:RNA-directed DNA polymerase, eukaryota [Tanacetum cinerariifolium]
MVMSGSQRSKEEDVQKISMSVFVTNFPDGTKAGKRFSFVRFMKVLDVDRLINNLRLGTNDVNHGAKGMTNSYTYVVKGNQVQNVCMEECPNMVLDDTCLKIFRGYEDFSLCMLGKVKEFASLTNLKVTKGLYGWRLRAFYVSGGPEIHLSVPHLDRVPELEEDSEEGYVLNDGSHEDDMYGVYRKTLKMWKVKVIGKKFLRQTLRKYLTKVCLKETLLDRMMFILRICFVFMRFLKKRDGKNINDKHEDSLKYLPGFTPNEEGDVPVEKVDNWSDENRVNDGRKMKYAWDNMFMSGWRFQMTHMSPHVLDILRSQKYLIKKINDTVSNYFIMVRGVWVSSGKRLLIISIYAPQDLSEKMLWDNLSFVIGNWDSKVVIMEVFNEVCDISESFGSIFDKHGAEAFNSFIVKTVLVEVPLVLIMEDFNEVCDISERFGSIFNKHGAKEFNSFIANAGLVEVPLGGCSFTISSTSLDGVLSDHRPIIMLEAHYEYGLIPFNSFITGSNLMVLIKKIRIWVRLHKESLNSRKSILKADLAYLDEVIDKGEGSNADGHRRREVVRLIQEVEKVGAMEMAQKAKIKWSIEGDENSKYYHGVLNKKRCRLTIRGVLVDIIWMESPYLVKHEFFKHFKNRFEKPNKSRILLERDFVKIISLEQNDDLEIEVSNEEIKRAVWDCGIDKAPGPDGFTFGFYRRYWDIIGNEVPNANMLKDFRPISLIGSLYRVIAKVLANCLVMVLEYIVDEIQFAFVSDSQILDGPFILNENVHWCMNKKKQSMIFKVDFEKAYDSVKWDFIDDILRRFGFGEIWCKWIQSCLYSSRASVLVNGSLTKEFQFHKGLKQGDPISPLLFILVMESLHVSFQRVLDADERVVWVEVEAVPCKWWSRNTFSHTASRWGTLLNGEESEEEGYHSNRICIRTKLKTVVFDSFKMVYRGMTCWVRAIKVPDVKGKSDREVVPETNFEEVPDKSMFKGNSVRQNDVHSEDLFGIYEVLNKKRDGKNIDDKHEDSLKYLSGFTPNEEGDVPIEKVDNWSDENIVNDGRKMKYAWDNMFMSGRRNWDGKVVIMEVFNEVCDISERFGSIFNKHGAEAFNSFIVNAGLVEVPLGEGSNADGHRRREVVRLIQEVEKVGAMEMAQKVKIKWSIEGDENSKYYHGVLNKKRCRLTIRENDDLEIEVSNEEIKRAVWDCGIDKAPGPNGFTFGFYQRYSDIIDFRPISLIESLYKVIAKVLANRLVTVLEDIVDEIQSAFVSDSQILDGPFILNENVHWCMNKKKQSMIFKVDFEKTYDSVRF